ncbi:MAG: ABC transporter permease [Candidatus Eremiobacteraeota bacterium]|nr:ABC transporter permease [Candidatus Eremiobacteraeota bacterium]
MTYLWTHSGAVWAHVLEHVALVLTALAIAVIVAFPIGAYAASHVRMSRPLFGTLAIIYTIPSLALLALLVRYVGLGFWTAVITLVAYAQFVLVRNVASGLRGVPRAQRDAARGIGMTPGQQFWRVQVPLALPIMLGGVRIATVSMIAIATLASYAAAGGLGVLIFDGLERQYPAETLAGSIPATVLAIGADLFLRGIERYATRYAR